MSDDNSDYIVVPMNLSPAERGPNPTLEKILAEKKFIRERILSKENVELVEDQEAMSLLNKLGSDLNINAFACNFRYPDGTINTSIEEANYLNRRIFEALSCTRADEDPLTIPFYITSTTFTQKDYKECADKFKERLGLEGQQDLFVLRNVVMSPFTTNRNFVSDLVDEFKIVLEREVKVCETSLILYHCWYSLVNRTSSNETPLSPEGILLLFRVVKINCTSYIVPFSIWQMADTNSSSPLMNLAMLSMRSRN